MIKHFIFTFISLAYINSICCMEKELTIQEMRDAELFNSINHKHYTRTERMLRAGANPNAIKDGLTAYAYAKQHGAYEICTLLAIHGAVEKIETLQEKSAEKEKLSQPMQFIQQLKLKKK